MEKVKAKYIVVKTSEIEAFRQAGYPVNPSKGLACVSKDTEVVFPVGGKYVLLWTEEPDSMLISDSLEEFANHLLREHGDETLIGKFEKAELYDGFPWLEGWE